MGAYKHIPVLGAEVIDLLAPQEGEVFVDATIGLGGHAQQVLPLLGKTGKLIGIDQDEQALQIASSNLAGYSQQLVLVHGNFRNLRLLLETNNIRAIDGILFDLGISSLQVDDPSRGFSFNNLATLDMRMDRSQATTALAIVNEVSYMDLVRIFEEYGEEPKAKIIAKRIVEARQKGPIETTLALADLVPGANYRIHPATKIFQALRIAVNQELEAIAEALPQALDLLKPAGRVAVITFHSLEDRIVKNIFKQAAETDKFTLVNKKVIIPSWPERKANRRSRSAKLRVIVKNS